jgi:hypothetical protein
LLKSLLLLLVHESLSGPLRLILKQHQANFRGYQDTSLEDQEMKDLFFTQALATHKSLVKKLGQRKTLLLTEGWDPVAIRRAQRQTQAQEASTNQPDLTPAPSIIEISNPDPKPAPSLEQVPFQQPGSSHQSWSGAARPNTQRRLNRRAYRNSIYGEMFRMARQLQGTYQYIDQSRHDQRVFQATQNAPAQSPPPN